MDVLFSVTETKKTDLSTLGSLFEERYLKAVEVTPHCDDAVVKQKLIEEVKGDGKNAFRRAKATKAKMLDWTVKMNPNQTMMTARRKLPLLRKKVFSLS